MRIPHPHEIRATCLHWSEGRLSMSIFTVMSSRHIWGKRLPSTSTVFTNPSLSWSPGLHLVSGAAWWVLFSWSMSNFFLLVIVLHGRLTQERIAGSDTDYCDILISYQFIHQMAVVSELFFLNKVGPLYWQNGYIGGFTYMQFVTVLYTTYKCALLYPLSHPLVCCI